jgi:hypothetical protein
LFCCIHHFYFFCVYIITIILSDDENKSSDTYPIQKMGSKWSDLARLDPERVVVRLVVGRESKGDVEQGAAGAIF